MAQIFYGGCYHGNPIGILLSSWTDCSIIIFDASEGMEESNKLKLNFALVLLGFITNAFSSEMMALCNF